MSGPKSGEITLDSDQWEALEAESREELEQLAALARRTEAQERRLQSLRKIEENRKARQMLVYQANLVRLQQSVAEHENRLQQCEGLAPPPVPAIPELDSTTSESIARCVAALASIHDAYVKSVNRAVATWQSQRQTTEELRKIASTLQPKAVQTADDVLARNNSSDQILAQRQTEAYLERAAVRANELISELQNEVLEQGALEALNDVLGATGQTEARVGLKRLENEVASQKEKIRRQEQARQRVKEQQRLAERRFRVAETISAALEEMGYESSTIDATAFAKDGRLYAIKNDGDWLGHGLLFTIDEGGERLVSEAVRIKGSSQGSSAAQMREEDLTVDSSWCSRDGIIELSKQARSRGLTLKFHKKHEPGDVTLNVIAEDELGEELQQKRSAWVKPKTTPLKTRNAK